VPTPRAITALTLPQDSEAPTGTKLPSGAAPVVSLAGRMAVWHEDWICGHASAAPGRVGAPPGAAVQHWE
jgi:hypothetical protein